MLKKILVIICVFSITGCAGIQHLPLSQDDSQNLSGKSLQTSVSKIPSFMVMTPGKGALMGFGLIGGLIAASSAQSEGQKLIEENGVPDPAVLISEQLKTTLADKYNLTVVGTAPIIAEQSKIPNLIEIAKSRSDLLLDVRTTGWQMIYLPSKWNEYRIISFFWMRLIDVQSQRVIAEEFAKYIPDSSEIPLTYDYLTGNNAAGLKRELLNAVVYSVDFFLKQNFDIYLDEVMLARAVIGNDINILAAENAVSLNEGPIPKRNSVTETQLNNSAISNKTLLKKGQLVEITTLSDGKISFEVVEIGKNHLKGYPFQMQGTLTGQFKEKIYFKNISMFDGKRVKSESFFDDWLLVDDMPVTFGNKPKFKWKIPPVYAGDIVDLDLKKGLDPSLEVTRVDDQFIEGHAYYPGTQSYEWWTTKFFFKDVKALNGKSVTKVTIPSIKPVSVANTVSVPEPPINYPKKSDDIDIVKTLDSQVVEKGIVASTNPSSAAQTATVPGTSINYFKNGDGVDIETDLNREVRIGITRIGQGYVEGIVQKSYGSGGDSAPEKFLFKNIRKLNGKSVSMSELAKLFKEPETPNRKPITKTVAKPSRRASVTRPAVQPETRLNLLNKGDDIDIETDMDGEISIEITQVGQDYIKGIVRKMVGSGGSDFPEKFLFKDIKKLNGKRVSVNNLSRLFN